MNQFVGKVCPYCKGEFTENDDVVVCSECEMPHHKDCWIENQGCTTFGCNGTIENPELMSRKTDSPDIDAEFNIELFPSDSDFIQAYCPACGSAHDPTDMFCKHCGHTFSLQNLNTVRQVPNVVGDQQYVGGAPQQPSYGLASDGEERYIVQNIGYYQRKFHKMRSGNKSTSWNWAAFFLAPYWCIYRKMYGIGAGVLGGAFVLSLLGVIGSVLLLAGYVVFGIFANGLYMQYVQKQNTVGSSLQEPMLTQHIQKNGGTNTLSAVLTAIGYAALVRIITL